MVGDLDAKVAIVTGGGSGIGAELVRLLSERGASVVAVDVDADGLAARAAATGCSTRLVDVSDETANIDMVQAATSDFGRLDLAFLNAGILGRPITKYADRYKVGELDIAKYRAVMAVNMDGVVYGTMACAEAMTAAGGGAIVATASAAGLLPFPPDPFYSATKHGVVGWVRAIAPALKAAGITIDAICPGGVATPLVGARDDAARIGPTLQPAEVAEAIITTALEDGAGRALSVLAGRDPVRLEHDFNAVPGF